MRARRAARARAIAIAIVAVRRAGRGAVDVLPLRYATDVDWCARHLFAPVVRRSLREHGLR